MNLGSSDFRFLRAWVQGVDVREAWHRYCPHRGPSDLRRVRTAVRSMLDQLTGVARRHGDVLAAALLKRDPARIASASSSHTSSTTAQQGRSIAAAPTL